MAKRAGRSIVTTGAGGSDFFNLDQGRHLLTVKWAGSPGDANVQVSDDGGTTWFNLRDNVGEIVNFTTDFMVIVFGRVAYRLLVNTHTSAATFQATDLDNRKLY